jgi:hypothetical protein
MEEERSENVKLSLFKTIKDWFWVLPLWKRFLTTSFLGFIVGTPYIYFINKFALFIYSAHNGIRQPIEGTGYLGFLVSCLSGILAISCFILSIVLFSLFGLSSKLGKYNHPRGEIENRVLNFKLFNRGFLLLILGVIYSLGITEHLSPKQNVILIFTIIIFAVGSSYIVIKIGEKKAGYRSLVSMLIVGFFYVVFSLLILYPRVYSNLIYSLGFGGGIPYHVQYEDTENVTNKVEGELILRTKTHFFIKDNEGINMEIPINRISNLKQK